MPTTSASSPEPAGLRARKKLARREALIDAAHELVERDGLDGATVEAICDRAGVSTRTFFNYFESKDDAVLGIEPWSVSAAVSDEFAAGGPTGRLLPDLEVIIADLLDAPMIGRVRMAAAMELARKEPRLLVRLQAWMEMNRAEIESLVRRRLGEDTPAYRLELVGIVAMVITRATFSRWESTGGDGVAGDHLAAVVDDLRALLAET
ncbi:TetR/AcrR family transcriptional regulator [Cellulomonas sp. P24]|uniref:TetR/AcrR family transcriptional regulator n=1 Tax=Cellulomonas sp. P24 TaxID=2885206 RepID=UPI00216B5211|nr:TetR/AcrR family transcriptional regulator [Cellulomonas sp. P24]MCR6493652.1 TetR/AcrR family transcriptional regulator [Cellulomonas sp. P24]